ncbi:hypothetical protein [Actinomadura macrotermitis]|uniref:Uncharacterized protein n=1 Tax=Actinomadura macrotermitis TaxID=2585200 RepID=A0A7K0BPW4_9ACTN|nr:hypothetical protein [Actinomadura macrotermitis]MQY03116.1 hypothetical protein [Actinomadura macrotermitis]
MLDHIAYSTGRLDGAASLPALLTAVFDGLELVERAATALAGPDADGARPGCAGALAEAGRARRALSGAPALRSAVHAGSGAERQELAEALGRFSMTLTEALVTATAWTTEPADRVACLRAALHLGRVAGALD